MTALSPKQMVAEALRDGQRWTASFKHFQAPLKQMQRDGEVHMVAPVGGAARNMVELTGRGWRVYFGENMLVSQLDQFAELVAEGFDPADAGRELCLTKGQTARAWENIKNQLGAQAA